MLLQYVQDLGIHSLELFKTVVVEILFEDDNLWKNEKKHVFYTFLTSEGEINIFFFHLSEAK